MRLVESALGLPMEQASHSRILVMISRIVVRPAWLAARSRSVLVQVCAAACMAAAIAVNMIAPIASAKSTSIILRAW